MIFFFFATDNVNFRVPRFYHPPKTRLDPTSEILCFPVGQTSLLYKKKKSLWH